MIVDVPRQNPSRHSILKMFSLGHFSIHSSNKVIRALSPNHTQTCKPACATNQPVDPSFSAVCLVASPMPPNSDH